MLRIYDILSVFSYIKSIPIYLPLIAIDKTRHNCGEFLKYSSDFLLSNTHSLMLNFKLEKLN